MNHGESIPLRAIVGGLSLCLAASPNCTASANTFLFEVSNVITPEEPSATVTLWGAFDPQWFAFHETRTEVFTGLDRGGFSDPLALQDDPKGFSKPGEVVEDGDRVAGIYIAQLYIPFSHFPNSANPIRLWSATWTTDDFTPRQVGLATESESFWVYHEDGGEFDMFGVDFAEGSGFITVVPAPGGVVVVLGAASAAVRRRRVPAP